MRVFIGIELSEEMKSHLATIQETVKKSCEKGKFTARENFHLTLRFIGDVSVEELGKIEEIISVHKVGMRPFLIETSRLGLFQKKNKVVVWLGIKPDENLQLLYKRISDALLTRNIPVAKEGAFIPHLSLGRGVVLSKEWDERNVPIPKETVQMTVSRITLFESKQVDGILRYLPLRHFPLEG